MKLNHLVVFASLSISACATHDAGNRPDSARAERTFSSASARLEAALARVSNLAPVAGTVSLTEPCAVAGTLGLAGTYDAGETGTEFDLTATFTGCHESEGTIDGSLKWTSEIDQTGTQIEEHWDGVLTGDDGTQSWSCTFDLTAIGDDAGLTYSGTICGYDVADLGM